MNPLHAIYRYGLGDIYLANEDLNDVGGLTVKIRAFDLKSKEIFSDQWKGDIKSNTSKFIFKLPEIKGLTPVWFLDLRVYDSDNKEVDNGIYWLSIKKDILDYDAAKKLDWAFYTPTKQFADYTALNQLPKVKLNLDYQFTKNDESGEVTLKVKNPSDALHSLSTSMLMVRQPANLYCRYSGMTTMSHSCRVKSVHTLQNIFFVMQEMKSR